MIEQALERWLTALNSPEPAHVEAALSPDARLHRYGIFQRREEVVQVFADHQEHLSWLVRSPEGTRFSVLSTEAVEEGWRVRYRIEVDDFDNAGWWMLRLGPDGRICELHHHADAIETPEFPARNPTGEGHPPSEPRG